MVEAGLGGVADATNVFEPAQLACAVITAIDNDHMSALGESQPVLLQHDHTDHNLTSLHAHMHCWCTSEHC